MITRIAIDPGHGGKDSGATGHGLTEAEMNYALALKLARLCDESLRMRAILTRSEHETASFDTRNRRAMDADVQMVVSVHCNASEDPTRHGLITLHWPGNTRMQEVCKVVQRCAPAPLYVSDRKPFPGLPDTFPRARNLLAAYHAPTILVECGYLTNAADAATLKDGRTQEGIALAICCALASA